MMKSAWIGWVWMWFGYFWVKLSVFVANLDDLVVKLSIFTSPVPIFDVIASKKCQCGEFSLGSAQKTLGLVGLDVFWGWARPICMILGGY